MSFLKYFGMIYSKSLYNNIFAEYKLNDTDVKAIQKVLFEMLLDFKRVCDKHNVKYMLSDGSILGAVRHNGFIPWDDDIDIFLTRENYQKFVDFCMDELKDKYMLGEPLSKGYYFKYPKLFLKNSCLTEIYYAGIPNCHMLFLDLFIVEYVPENVFKRKMKGLLYYFAYGASAACLDYLFPSPIILEKTKENSELKKYYNFRRHLGWLFSHAGGVRFYLHVCDWLARSTKKSSVMCPVADSGFFKGVFEKDVFTEAVELRFEEEFFPVPAKYNYFLEKTYGLDYMCMPSEEKRESHLACDFRLPD